MQRRPGSDVEGFIVLFARQLDERPPRVDVLGLGDRGALLYDEEGRKEYKSRGACREGGQREKGERIEDLRE